VGYCPERAEIGLGRNREEAAPENSNAGQQADASRA
jgi:hypothetical protein